MSSAPFASVSSSSLTFSDMRIERNHFPYSPFLTLHDSNSILTVSHSFVLENFLTEFVLFESEASLLIDNTTTSSNFGSFAVNEAKCNITVANSIFSLNSSPSLYFNIDDSTITFDNTTFEQNALALSFANSTVSINNSVFGLTSPHDYLIILKFSAAEMSNVSFVENSPYKGDVALFSSKLLVESSIFHKSTAANLLFENSTVAVAHSEFGQSRSYEKTVFSGKNSSASIAQSVFADASLFSLMEFDACEAYLRDLTFNTSRRYSIQGMPCTNCKFATDPITEVSFAGKNNDGSSLAWFFVFVCTLATFAVVYFRRRIVLFMYGKFAKSND